MARGLLVYAYTNTQHRVCKLLIGRAGGAVIYGQEKLQGALSGVMGGVWAQNTRNHRLQIVCRIGGRGGDVWDRDCMLPIEWAGGVVIYGQETL